MDIKRIDFGDTLSDEQILALIEGYSAEKQAAINADRYAKGDNAYIMDRVSPDENAPDNKVPVSYARKIISTIVGYMYKPGLVRYASDDEAYMESLNEVFRLNSEPIKTAQLGRQTSVQGVGYEFHYVGAAEGDERTPLKAVPRFAMLPVSEVIPVHSYDIEPVLKAFIRWYKRGDKSLADVYYPLRVDHYELLQDDNKLEALGRESHPYPVVPLNIYRNNDEMLGDFSAVRPLIDAYDVLMSDSMNEFDRFAWAYLLLKGFGLSNKEAQDIKWKRMFENLDADDAVSFLTKDIPTEYIKFMAEWCRMEIHSQSGIPDVNDLKFGAAASGTTIDKFIYLMELFTDPKEALFRQGLERRIEIVNTILKVRDGSEGKPVEITMSRNLPVDDIKNADALTKYSGHVTERTLLQNFAPFVKDVDKELAALDEEKQKNLEQFGDGLMDQDADENVADAEDQDDSRQAVNASERR